MKNQSFVNSLGRDYAHDTLAGAVFLHEGIAYSLESIDDECDEFVAMNLSTNTRSRFDSDLIKGWKMFKYPKLGYRSFSPTVAAWCSRNQSYNRGLNGSNLRVQFTNFTEVLFNNSQMTYDQTQRDRMVAVLLPTFGNKQQVQELFDDSSVHTHVVLNEDVLIEQPVLTYPDARMDVFFRNNLLGSLSRDGTIHADSAANHKLIERIVRTHVS